MLVSEACASAYQALPSREEVAQKFSTSLPPIAHAASQVAIPALALYALSNIPGAAADAESFARCLEECLSNGSGIWHALWCNTICGIELAFN